MENIIVDTDSKWLAWLSAKYLVNISEEETITISHAEDTKGRACESVALFLSLGDL